jgi:CheY-like chemotaxis protein
MTTKKILLVDDTKLFLELEKNFLKRSPVRIITAANGNEALEVARNERPDLIFMDIHMPGMDGVTCCGKIKDDPELCSIPVVMVSTSAKDEDLALCRQAGCDDYITKPIDRRIFLEKARSFLEAIDRRETRITYQTPVSFAINGTKHDGLSCDLSCGGIYVATEAELQEKLTVDLTITLPHGECPVIAAQGTVAWENSGTNRRKPALPAGFGVEFIEMRESDSRHLQTFIAASKTTE